MPLVADLVAVLGPERVKHHPLELFLFGRDAGISTGEAVAAVFCESTADVVAVVRVARRHVVPIIPRGAGTGLAGGAVPAEPAVVLVLTRLDEVEIDPESKNAWVGPGVINLDLSKLAAPHGLHYAPDPSSQSACTIGGNVGTNAGGPHCLADGTTVSHVLAVEFVTADGEVLLLGGAAPDPIGLDLTQGRVLQPQWAAEIGHQARFTARTADRHHPAAVQRSLEMQNLQGFEQAREGRDLGHPEP